MGSFRTPPPVPTTRHLHVCVCVCARERVGACVDACVHASVHAHSKDPSPVALSTSTTRQLPPSAIKYGRTESSTASTFLAVNSISLLATAVSIPAASSAKGLTTPSESPPAARSTTPARRRHPNGRTARAETPGSECAAGAAVRKAVLACSCTSNTSVCGQTPRTPLRQIGVTSRTWRVAQGTDACVHLDHQHGQHHQASVLRDDAITPLPHFLTRRR